jgi:hypothetical protein
MHSARDYTVDNYERDFAGHVSEKNLHTKDLFVNDCIRELVSIYDNAVHDGLLSFGLSHVNFCLPFNPVTGIEYDGINLFRLMLAQYIHQFDDPRWIMASEFQQYKDLHPEFEMRLKKKSKSFTILQLFEVDFLRNPHSLHISNDAGTTFKGIIFVPCEVYNGSQINGFPDIKAWGTPSRQDLLDFAERLTVSGGISVERRESSTNITYELGERKIFLPNFNDFDDMRGCAGNLLAKAVECRFNAGPFYPESSFGLDAPVRAQVKAFIFSVAAAVSLGVSAKLPSSYNPIWVRAYDMLSKPHGHKAFLCGAIAEVSSYIKDFIRFHKGEPTQSNWFVAPEQRRELVDSCKKIDAVRIDPATYPVLPDSYRGIMVVERGVSNPDYFSLWGECLDKNNNMFRYFIADFSKRISAVQFARFYQPSDIEFGPSLPSMKQDFLHFS